MVKSGDTLGGIAYGNGINIRQLKELNGLSSDVIRVGQTLKIPAAAAAAAVAPAAKPAAAVAPAVVAPAAVEVPQPVVDEVQPVVVAPVVEEPVAPVVEAAPAAPEAPAEVATTSYVVQEGDDMTSVSISWGVSAAAIRELNNLGEDAPVTPGMKLKLPLPAQQ